MSQNRGRTEQMSRFVEGSISFQDPREGSSRKGELGEGCCNLAVILNESPVEISKSQELLELLAFCGYLPFSHCLYLNWVRSKLSLSENK